MNARTIKQLRNHSIFIIIENRKVLSHSSSLQFEVSKQNNSSTLLQQSLSFCLCSPALFAIKRMSVKIRMNQAELYCGIGDLNHSFCFGLRVCFTTPACCDVSWVMNPTFQFSLKNLAFSHKIFARFFRTSARSVLFVIRKPLRFTRGISTGHSQNKLTGCESLPSSLLVLVTVITSCHLTTSTSPRQ